MNPFCLQVVTVQVNGLDRSSVKVMPCHACQTVSCYSCDVLQQDTGSTWCSTAP